MDINLLLILILKQLKGVGTVKINSSYLSRIKTVNSMDELTELIGKLEPKLTDSDIIQAKNAGTELYEKIESDDTLKVVTALDNEYPSSLNQLGQHKPVMLYIRGNTDVLEKSSISVVGTREPSVRTLHSGPEIVKKLIQVSDRPIVSGLALGCDRIAHETALNCGRETIAVLPSGLDNISPSSNKELAAKIISDGGCLISEYEPNVSAQKYTAVRRDTLIAALSAGTLVMECGIKSGTMHTVDAAIELDHPIACFLPADVNTGYDGNKYIVENRNGIQITFPSDIQHFISKLGVY